MAESNQYEGDEIPAEAGIVLAAFVHRCYWQFVDCFHFLLFLIISPPLLSLLASFAFVTCSLVGFPRNEISLVLDCLTATYFDHLPLLSWLTYHFLDFFRMSVWRLLSLQTW
ncbi:hypothetical protein M6B38_100150 [Iris pallida]|uniref:Uncharacterized protein n=1 Tax=Iris pallida TaxID=29817 RepID=A0AAX6IL19_IRIPA|nr:hypothetical protein M6B38_100150 [Iris pallida]